MSAAIQRVDDAGTVGVSLRRGTAVVKVTETTAPDGMVTVGLQ